MSSKKSNQFDDEEEEYDDEGFEDYDDDFEDDAPESPIAQSKISSNNNNNNNNNNKNNLEKKNINTITQPQFTTKVSSSLTSALKSIDPRAKRLAKLMASGVLELEEKKLDVQISFAPSSQYDVYRRNLKSNNSNIKQFAVPDDSMIHRDIECNTEQIVTSDKHQQFPNSLEIYLSKTNGGLENFLQESTRVIETLLEEESRKNKGNKKNIHASIGSIFSSDDRWESFGSSSDKTTRSNELIHGRSTIVTKFSTLQPYIFMTAHPQPSPNSDHNDPKPLKGLYGIWNINTTNVPVYYLEGTGIPTCCCFSSTQSFIVIAGTSEGSILLWDLREENSIHEDKVSIELSIERGIRKPCYNANLSLNSSNEVELDQHTTSIVQIESLGGNSDKSSASTTISQFASLDESGIIIFWVTTFSSQSSTEIDFGLSPWSSISLIQIGILRIGGNLTKEMQINNNFITPSFCSNNCFCTVPSDPSLLLASFTKGSVKKLARFRDPSAPLFLCRPESEKIEILSIFPGSNIQSSNQHEEEFIYDAIVSCISVRNELFIGNNSSDPTSLVVVGRVDGTIDLFQLNHSYPLQSWNLKHFEALITDNGSRINNKIGSIIFIRWCTSKLASFLVVDSRGYCYYFDLLENPLAPLYCEKIDINNLSELTIKTIDLSVYKNGSRNINMIVTNTKGQIYIRKLWDGLFISNDNIEKTKMQIEQETIDKNKFNMAMSGWISRAIGAVRVVTVIKESNQQSLSEMGRK